MDSEFLITLMKILVFFPLVIGLIFLVGKIYGGVGYGNRGKNMRAIERVHLSKDNLLTIMEICGKFYLISSSTKDIKILKELDEEEVNKGVNPQTGVYKNELLTLNGDVNSFLKLKFRRKNKSHDKKDDNYEK